MSLPCHQPEKWKGMKAVSGATRGVTSALTLIRAPVGVETTTYSPSRMPRSAAAFGLISTKLSCCSSASHGFERVSSPPPSYSTSRPDVRMIGNFSYSLVSMFFCCTVLYSVGRRQNAFLSSCVGYFAARSGRVTYSNSRCSGTGSGKFHTTAHTLALPKGWQPCFIATHKKPPNKTKNQNL